jgi:TetR/AcrR family transcriptional repressor of bet genes
VIERDRALLEDLVREALRAEEARTHDARRIAAGLLAAVEGAFRLAVLAPEVIPEGAAAQTVRQMADGLLAAAGGRNR